MAQAKDGDAVKVHYTARFEDGTVFDSSLDRRPLQFTIGADRIIPGFEQAVVGMHPGESKTTRIPMDEAYGQRREDKVVTVGRDRFRDDLKLEIGQTLEITSSGGRRTVVRVTDTSESEVSLDANHPLAGKDLILDIQLIEIMAPASDRKASED
jgi:FKBP-type peptidyl-prolyl cis-trans isomerase 2